MENIQLNDLDIEPSKIVAIMISRVLLNSCGVVCFPRSRFQCHGAWLLSVRLIIIYFPTVRQVMLGY